tara:strand:+ start:62 stop:1069 length:1008 start_codon:yes stop_codon:yes gene_type:complete
MASDAFAALDNMLTKREESKSRNRQYSLALMQFDYQRKQAEIAQTGKNLELFQAANSQMMNNVAQEFMSESGLDMLYSAEKDGGEDAQEELIELGLSKRDASKVTSAIWAYKVSANPLPILKLGRKLKNLSQSESLNSEQKMFIKGLGSQIGLISGSEFDIKNAKSLLNRTDGILKNQDDIMKEVYEYSSGEYEIQRDIGLSFDKLEEEQSEEDSDLSTPYIPNVKQMVADSRKTFETAENDLFDKENALKTLEDELNVLQQLRKRGTLDESQGEYLDRIPVMMEEFNSELEELSEVVAKSKEDLTKNTTFEAQTKLSDFMEMKREASGGSYQPF